MKRTLMLLLLFVSTPCWAQEAEMLSHFVAGSDAYRSSKYSDAVREYEIIVQSGKASGNVYYNLANSYFKKGDKGKAIVNYERALRLMPRDSDLLFNARFAKSGLPKYASAKNNIFQKLMNNHVKFYSLNEMVIILSVIGCIILFGGLLLFYFNVSTMIFRCSLIGGCLLFLVFYIGFNMKTTQQHNQAIVISEAKALFEPKEKAVLHYSLKEGESVTIMRETDDWVKVKRPDRKMGWVKANLIEEI